MIYDEEDVGGGQPYLASYSGSVETVATFKNGIATLTKAEAENIDKKLSGGESTEGLIVEGRVKRAKIVVVKAAGAKEAAIAVRKLLGPTLNTEKFVTVETTAYKEETAQP